MFELAVLAFGKRVSHRFSVFFDLAQRVFARPAYGRRYDSWSGATDIKQANVERFNTVASEWDRDSGRVLLAQKVARAMRAALSPTGQEQALEFGAGTGLVTLLMAPKLAHVTVLDSSAGMLEVLRQKCEKKQLTQVENIEGTVPDQLPDAQYDLIYSSMTMHHIEHVPALLKTLAGHVKPGGRVALADLDAEDGGFHGEAKGVAHHEFARETFGSWLGDAGFSDVRFSTAFTVHRESDDGTTHDYPIFLVIASKPGP